MNVKTITDLTIEAKIIKKNGEIEDLGVICKSKKSLLRRIKEVFKWQMW